MKKELLKKSIIIMGVVVLCLAIPFGASAYTPQGAISVLYTATDASSPHTTEVFLSDYVPDTYYNVYSELYNLPGFIPRQYVRVAFNPYAWNYAFLQIEFDTALFYYAEEFTISIVVPSTTSTQPLCYTNLSGINIDASLHSQNPIDGMYFWEFEIYGSVPNNTERFILYTEIKASATARLKEGIAIPISYLNVTYSEDFSNAGYLASIADSNNNISQNIGGIFSSLQTVINEQAMADPDFVAGLEDLRQDILQDYINLDQAVTDFENNFNNDQIYDDFYGSLDDLTRGELPSFLSMFYTEFMGGGWFWIEMASVFGGLALFSKVVFG